MVLFIVILCSICFVIGYLSNEEYDRGYLLGLLVAASLCSLCLLIFVAIKGEWYFKPVYRKGDSVVYRDTQYGRVDTVLYIINKDTVYYGEID